MGFTKEDAKQLLHARSLRVTGARIAILCVLGDSHHPLSHREVVDRLGETDWDPSTIYRNLVKLRESGIAPVASRAEGIDRYALDRGDGHRHPHFFCEDCGRVTCLPRETVNSLGLTGPWAESVAAARIQLRGACPDCLASSHIVRRRA
ncbi:MAG: transcriptional repressor [Myxococcota bacterium]